MKKVMIADDEMNVRTALQLLIPWQELDCEIVYTAKNGAEVLKALDTYQPDILVIDIKMPVTDGLEVARQLYEKKSEISVILLTAYAEFEYARRALQYRVSEYIVKTAVLEQLPDAIKRVCASLDERNSRSLVKRRREFLYALLKGAAGSVTVSEEYRCVWQAYAKENQAYLLLLLHAPSGAIGPLPEEGFCSCPYTVLHLNAEESCALFSGSLPARQELQECCEKFLTLSGKQPPAGTLFGISNVFNDITMLPDALASCRLLTDALLYENASPVLFVSDSRRNEDRLVQQVNEYIEGNYCLRITLADMAGCLHINRSYLSHIYKEKTGKNIFDVINEKRLDAAKKMIRQTDLRLNEIAVRVGFDDAAYFSRFFRKYTGMSPKDYKDRSRGREESL